MSRQPWTRDEARGEARQRFGELSAAITEAEAKGQCVATLACVFRQDSTGVRLQLWDRARLPEPGMRELIEESVRLDPEADQKDMRFRLPVLLWSLDGAMWITWVQAIPLAAGGDS